MNKVVRRQYLRKEKENPASYVDYETLSNITGYNSKKKGSNVIFKITQKITR